MDTATFDAGTLTLLGTIVGSMLTMVSLTFLQFNRLDRKIDALDTKIDRKIDALDTKFTNKTDASNTQITNLDRRFDAVDARFDAVDARFEAVDARFDIVDARFEAVDARFDIVDARFEAVDARFDIVDARFDKLDGKVDAMGHSLSDARERLARIEGYLMAPEDFRAAGFHPPEGADRPAGSPPSDHRASG